MTVVVSSRNRSPAPDRSGVTRYVKSPGLPRGFRFSDRLEAPLALRPTGLVRGAAAAAAMAQGGGRALCAGALVFTGCEVFLHGADAVHIAPASLAGLGDWAAGEGGVAETVVAATLTL